MSNSKYLIELRSTPDRVDSVLRNQGYIYISDETNGAAVYRKTVLGERGERDYQFKINVSENSISHDTQKYLIDVRTFGTFERYIRLVQEDSPVKIWAVKDDINFEVSLETIIQHVELAIALEKSLATWLEILIIFSHLLLYG